MSKFYIRRFSQESWDFLTPYTKMWSNYFPPPIKSCIYHPKLKNSDYILCPMYRAKKKNNLNDFQVGVTGDVRTQEEYIIGAIREIGEEIGLRCKESDLHFIKNAVLNPRAKPCRRRKMVIYMADIKDLTPLEEEYHDIDHNDPTDPDDRLRKIGCIVYGNYLDILKFLNSEKIYRYNAEDGIIGIVAVPVSEVRKKYPLRRT